MVMMHAVNSDTHPSQLSPNSSPGSPKSNSSPDICTKFQKIDTDRSLQTKVDNILMANRYHDGDDIIEKPVMYVSRDLHDAEINNAKFSIERLKQLTDHSINRLSPSDDSNTSGNISSDQKCSNSNNNNTCNNINNNNRSTSPSKTCGSPQRKQQIIDIEINSRNFLRQANNLGINHLHQQQQQQQFQIKQAQVHTHSPTNHHSLHHHHHHHHLAHLSINQHIHQQQPQPQQHHSPNPQSIILHNSPQQNHLNPSTTTIATATTISTTAMTTNTDELDIERIKLATAAARTMTNGRDLSDYGFRIQLGGLPTPNYARSDTSEELIVDGNEDSTSQDAPSVSL